ncbi:hypothetical protein D3C87_1479030 [compost metagenome]
MTGKFDLGTFGAEGQVGAPEQTVIAEGNALMAKVRTVDGNASTAQPAQQADHQHQERLFAKTGEVIVLRAGFQADDRPFSAHGQGAAKVPQEQGEVDQALAHGFVQVGLLDQRPADQGEAARWHAVGVEAEEFVVEFADLDQPQGGKCTGRHPCRGLFHRYRVDARLFQRSPHALWIVPLPLDHGLHEVGGHRVFFPHLNASLPMIDWQKTPVALNSFGIGQPPCQF